MEERDSVHLRDGNQVALIIGSHEDLCARLTYEYLLQRGTEAIFIENAHLLTAMAINWSFGCSHNNGFLTINSYNIPFASISGVLNRMKHMINVDPKLSPQDQKYIRFEIHAALLGLLNSLDCCVINRPIPGMGNTPVFANAEKIRLIMECGFKIPKTLFTSSYDRAFMFYKSCNRVAVVGSSSGELLRRLIRNDEEIGLLQDFLVRHPIYLQEVPSGQWLQVFTVGNRAFGALSEIDLISEEKEKSLVQSADLLPSLEERCWKLAQALNLDFSHIHLLKTDQGDVYCFDVSAFPIYDSCDDQLQKDITNALAELLQGEKR